MISQLQTHVKAYMKMKIYNFLIYDIDIARA